MFGEALILVNDDLKDHFRFNMKQRGAILAKGWMIGVQFEELFQDNLYLELGKRSVALAQRLKQGFIDCKIPFLCDSPTNQLFPIFPNEFAKKSMRIMSQLSSANRMKTIPVFVSAPPGQQMNRLLKILSKI